MKSKRESIIKLILLVFFLIFFIFLFLYFYKPTEDKGFVEKMKTDFNLFPFSGLFVSEPKPTEDDFPEKEEKVKEKTERPPRLRQISTEPTAGVYFNLLNTEELKKYNKILDKDEQVSPENNVSEIRYILSKNSHIYSTFTNSLQEERISNITIPKIQEVLFFDEDNFLVRYLNDNVIKTYSIILSNKIEEKQEGDGTTTPSIKNFNGLFLPNDILEITILPFQEEVFYLYKNKKGGGVVGARSGKWGENQQEVSSFDFSEWNIEWVGPNKILFTSKPSKKTHSISMVYDLKNNTFLKISKALLAGNTLANHNFSKILYSGIINNKYTLLVYDLNTKTRKYLDKTTLVEKCVWSQNNIDVYCATPSYINSQEQPDAWYRGYNYFIDNIYKINTESGEAQLVYFNFDNNPDFDIIDPKLDEAERYIYWIDKKTNTAWSWELFDILSKKEIETETEEKTE